jgi:hypothetical protein
VPKAVTSPPTKKSKKIFPLPPHVFAQHLKKL